MAARGRPKASAFLRWSSRDHFSTSRMRCSTRSSTGRGRCRTWLTGQESHGANGYNGYNQIILNWTILGNWKLYFWDPPFYKHCMYESHPHSFTGRYFSVFTRGQRIIIRCCILKNIISQVSNATCFDIYNLLLISNGHLQHLVVVVDRGWAPRST